MQSLFYVPLLIVVLICSAVACFGPKGVALYVLALAACVRFGPIWPTVARVTYAILIIIGLAVLLLPSMVASAPSAARRMQCANNMKQIYQAIIFYRSTFKEFPPPFIADKSGRPMHSWRVLILPYLGEKQLYKKYNFNEPWDGPNNRRLFASRPAVYACPSDERGAKPSSEAAYTSYAAITGEKTAWQNTLDVEEFQDRAPATILLAETDAEINWTEPRDISIDVLQSPNVPPDCPKISSKHGCYSHDLFYDYETDFTPQGAYVTTADGRQFFIEPHILRSKGFTDFLHVGAFEPNELQEIRDLDQRREPQYQSKLRWTVAVGLPLFVASTVLLLLKAVQSRRRSYRKVASG